MEERMADLNELLDSTENKLKIDIDAKYEDQMKKIKNVAGEIGHFSNVILQSNNRLEKVYGDTKHCYPGFRTVSL